MTTSYLKQQLNVTEPDGIIIVGAVINHTYYYTYYRKPVNSALSHQV
jgi:hypothetical protein